MSIQYSTFRAVSPSEELYICYGREEDLWWNRGTQSARPPSQPEDDWQALSNIEPVPDDEYVRSFPSSALTFKLIRCDCR